MDGSSTIDIELSAQQQKLALIKKRLEEPNLQQVKTHLSLPENTTIQKELLTKPDLFLMLLDNPGIILILSKNTRPAFLKDIQQNSNELIDKLSLVKSTPTQVTQIQDTQSQGMQIQNTQEQIAENQNALPEMERSDENIFDNLTNMLGNFCLEIPTKVSAALEEATSYIPKFEGASDGVSNCLLPMTQNPLLDYDGDSETDLNSDSSSENNDSKSKAPLYKKT